MAPFAVLTWLVEHGWSPVQRIDVAVTRWTANFGASKSGYVDTWRLLEVVFDPWAFRAVAVGLAVWLWHRKTRLVAAWLVVTVTVQGAAGLIVKQLVQRPRPPGALAPGDGFSYPSGHAATAALVCGAALLIVPVVRGWRGDAKLYAALAAGIVVLVTSLDRIILAVHHPTDVLGGWALALAVLSITTGAFRLRPRRRPRRPPKRTVEAIRAEEPPRPRCAVIVNPVKLVDPRWFRRRLERRLARFGWDQPLWMDTTIDDPGRAMAAAAIEAGVDLVLVAGGDGTTRVVCGELAGSDIPVGVIPAGTGNLLARNLDIPLDVDEATDLILDGEQHRIDIAAISGDGIGPSEHFTVMAGLGIDAAIVTDTPPELKRHIGWTAYLVAAVKNFSYPAVRVSIRLDEGPPLRRNVRSVVVANVGNLQGGIELLPEAEPDDGLLDVLVIAPRRLLHWPGLVVKVLARRPAIGEHVEHFTCRQVSVVAAKPVPRQLDGDIIGEGLELTAAVNPGGLLLRLPRPRPTLRYRVQQVRDELLQVRDDLVERTGRPGS